MLVSDPEVQVQGLALRYGLSRVTFLKQVGNVQQVVKKQSCVNTSPINTVSRKL